MDLIKIENFCAVYYNTIKKIKRQPIEWEKILVSGGKESPLAEQEMQMLAVRNAIPININQA